MLIRVTVMETSLPQNIACKMGKRVNISKPEKIDPGNTPQI